MSNNSIVVHVRLTPAMRKWLLFLLKTNVEPIRLHSRNSTMTFLRTKVTNVYSRINSPDRYTAKVAFELPPGKYFAKDTNTKLENYLRQRLNEYVNQELTFRRKKGEQIKVVIEDICDRLSMTEDDIFVTNLIRLNHRVRNQ